MKRLTIMLLLAVLFLHLAATETRMASMGGVGMYMRDDSTILSFPGLIRDFAGMAKVELRARGNDYNNYSAMTILPLKESAFGLVLNQPIELNAPVATLFPEVDLSRGTLLMYGMESNGMNLGFEGIMILDSDEMTQKFEYGVNTIEITEKTTAFAVGVGMGASTDVYDFGATFILPAITREDESYDDEVKSLEDTWGGFEFGAQARGFRDYGMFNLIPLVVFNYSGSTYEDEKLFEIGDADLKKSDETTYSDLQVAVGVGLEYAINETNRIILGLEAFGLDIASRETTQWSYNYSLDKFVDDKTEYTYTTMVMPGLYAGVESRIKPWLTGRFGAAQVYSVTTGKIKYDDGDEVTDKSASKDFDVTFGLGFHFGGFTLDATLNEGLLFEGPNFISGGEEDMNYQLSLMYNF